VPRNPERLLARVVLGALTASVCVSGLTGCQAINSGLTPSTVQLRVIDATPGMPALDVYSGNSAVAYNLGFGTVTSYVPLTSPTDTLTVNTAGTRSALASLRAVHAPARQYTLLVRSGNSSLQSQILTDQSQPAPAGQVSLRFLDEARSAGPMDLYLVPAGSTLSNAVPLQAGLISGANTGYRNVPAGTYTLYLVPSDGSNITTAVPLYAGASTTYPSGSVRTILMLDQPKTVTASVQVITTSDFESTGNEE
jgi:hypothetical protein